MKNINKILGVVLTVAMLAGLIMMAVPVSAGNLSWSSITAPKFTVGTNANVFTIAADGKTMYMYTPITTYLTAADNDSTAISVDSTDGFPSVGEVTIGGDGPFTYTGNLAALTTPATEAKGAVVAAAGSTFAGMLYRSSDAGYTWTKIVLHSSDPLLGKDITSIKICKDDASNLIATDGATLYKSTDSGTEWSKEKIDGISDSYWTSTPKITSIDISVNDSGDVVYLVGLTDGTDFANGGVALYDGGWQITWATGDENALGADDSWHNVITTTVAAGTADYGVYAAAFAPDYGSNNAIVALCGDSSGVYLRTLVSLTGYDWEGDLYPDKIGDNGADTGITGKLAFPSNYDYSSNSYAKVFVGLGSSDTTSYDHVGVWKTTPSKVAVKNAYETDKGINVNSMAYKGTLSSGTLAVGLVDNTDVYTSTDAGTASDGNANFSESADNNASPFSKADAPKVKVAFSPTSSILYAGTTGDYSGLYASNNDSYNSFWGISFFNVASLASVAIGKDAAVGSPAQISVYNDGTDYMIFNATGNLIYNDYMTPIDAICISPAFATDKTIYFVQKEMGPPNAAFLTKLLKTSDAGISWDSVTTPGAVHASGIAVIDGSTYFAGSTDGIRKSGSSVTVALDSQTPQVMIDIPGFFLIFTDEGGVYLSQDDGASFTQLGSNTSQFKNVFQDFVMAGGPPPTFEIDPPAKTIYAQEHDTGNILKWTVGTDDSWQTFLNISDLPEEITNLGNTADYNHGISGFAKKGDTWFIWSLGNPYGQLWRSTDITDTNNKGFNPVYETEPTQTIGGNIGHGPIAISVDSNGNFVYEKDIAVGVSSGKIGDQYKNFVDTLTNAPAVIAPAANASVDKSVDFSWKAVSGSEIKYDLQVDYTADFNSNILDQTGQYASSAAYTATSATQINSVALDSGKTYYWRVRSVKLVGTGASDQKEYMVSKWSDPVQFTTKMASSASSAIDVVGRISPANGSTGIATNATLGWGTVDTATGYNVVIATDSAFTNVFDQATGLTVAVYMPTKAFTPATTYFWKVQAVNGTNAGNWIASSFTTAATAAASAAAPATSAAPQTVIVTAPAQPTPIINYTAPAAATTPPTTPGYVWVIIVIGAILVIAVIVLIVRTRRV